MGRNIEGVRAGSLAWFGKEPDHLSDAEAALLVALPRDPTRLRPDRIGTMAEAARARVLRRAAADGVLPDAALASALAAPMPASRHPMPMLAPHLGEQLARRAPAGARIATTLDGTLQEGAERVLAQALHELPRPMNLAALVADWHSGAVLARVGSADYHDARRAGAIDMTRAVRSPGSTLKPFIYGMAFDGLLAHPGSLVRDAATRFDDYAPHNFDGTFTGDVTVRQALQASLNLPAVLTLRRLGPVVFTERFKAAGLDLELGSSDAAPGLPIALGGVGTTLETLVTAYAALANGGAVTPLTETGAAAPPVPDALFAPGAADAVVDILAGMPPPKGVGGAGRIAFKTGTSFRFRDGWAVGFDGARVIGVWMGRADGGTCACVGASAATILFRLFDLLPPAPLPPRVLDARLRRGPSPRAGAARCGRTPARRGRPAHHLPDPPIAPARRPRRSGGHQARRHGWRETLSLDGRWQAGREPPLRARDGVAARRHRLFDRLGRRRARPRRPGFGAGGGRRVTLSQIDAALRFGLDQAPASSSKAWLADWFSEPLLGGTRDRLVRLEEIRVVWYDECQRSYRVCQTARARRVCRREYVRSRS